MPPFILFILPFLVIPFTASASGNYPEAGTCPPEKPYFAICTHSFHNLEGWYSNNCHSTQNKAQKDANNHVKKYHQGNSRWTGIKKQGSTGYKLNN
jgi:hypothetical protein